MLNIGLLPGVFLSAGSPRVISHTVGGTFQVFVMFSLMRLSAAADTAAAAKLVNTATNVSALALFVGKGHIWWHFVFVMALANVLGSWLGTLMALRHGTGFVRAVFLLVVSALILKTGADAFLR